MPNTNRPADTRCPVDPDGYLTCETDASGVCRYCGLGTCAVCDGPVTRAEAADPRQAPGRSERLCGACLAEDSDAVPVAVDEEPTKAERTPTDAELLAERMGVAS